MSVLLDALYLMLLVALSPWLAYKALTTGKYRRGLVAKFLGSASAIENRKSKIENPVVWFHGVSVGEIHLLRQVVAAFRRRHPDWECVVSTTTDTGFDEARNHFELRAENGSEGVAARGRCDVAGERHGEIISCGRCGNGVVEQSAGVDRMLGHAAVSLGLHVGIGQSENAGEGLEASAADAGEGDSASGRDGVLGNGVAHFEGIGAAQGHGEGDRRAGLHGRKQVGTTAAPPGQWRAIRNGGLPLRHLVGMGKELRWLGERTRLVLRAGHGINQRPGIEKDREFALAK